MQIEYLKPDELIPYANNPRNNDDAVKYIAESIKTFGFKSPILIDKDNVIIAGHTRLKAAYTLGLKTVPVIRATDLTDEQVKGLRLADNKTAELSDWDYNALALEMSGITNIDMAAFGFEIEPVTIDGFGEEFELPDGDKPPIVTMTLTLKRPQVDIIENILVEVDENDCETFGNTDNNGNKIYKITKEWVENAEN